MREFDYDYKNIFHGLSAKEVNRKAAPELLECHNVEPTGEDYKLHEAVIDMNATGYDWLNPAVDNVDYWIDHGSYETYWEQSGSSGVTWVDGTAYIAGDEVIGTDTLNYTCVLGHTATPSNVPITGAGDTFNTDDFDEFTDI